MEDTGKLEERNKIVSELQTIIKERIELKEIECLANWYHLEKTFHPTWQVLHKRIKTDEYLLGLITMGNLTK